MAQTAIIIGVPETCRRLERQLDLLPQRPRCLGWVLAAGCGDAAEAVVLGVLDDLESVVDRARPDLALVSLPAAMSDLITSVRTRLRRAGVADRFMPTLEDQIAGIGPRSRLEIDPSRLLDRPARAIDERAVSRLIRSHRVLITGAGGSIGSELARIVSRYQPATLALMDRSENALFEIDRQIARSVPGLRRETLLHDVVDASGTLRHFRHLRPQVVFHAAAHKHVPMMEHHPAAAVDNNLFGTKSVADAADATGTERFVLISTDKAVNPRSVMGATKRLAEMYVQHLSERSRTGFAIVRFGNVLGSSGSVLDVWSKEISEGGPLTLTDPRMTRYFMTIPEAAALVIQATLIADTGRDEVFLLNMGEPVRVIELARRFIDLHGLTGSIRIAMTGARPGEKIHEQLAFEANEVRPSEHPDIRRCNVAAPDGLLVRRMLEMLAPARRGSDRARIAEAVHGLVSGRLHPVAA